MCHLSLASSIFLISSFLSVILVRSLIQYHVFQSMLTLFWLVLLSFFLVQATDYSNQQFTIATSMIIPRLELLPIVHSQGAPRLLTVEVHSVSKPHRLVSLWTTVRFISAPLQKHMLVVVQSTVFTLQPLLSETHAHSLVAGPAGLVELSLH